MTTPRTEDFRKAKEAKDAKKAAAAALEWIRDSRKRVMVGNLDNLRQALTQLKVTVSYDAFARELRINGAPIVDDIAFEQIWTRITDTCGWQPNRRNLQTVILCDAHATATHPVRTYLDSLTWDNTPRLDRWLVTYGGAVETEYVRAVGALPLIAAVRRVRQPGAKFDELLILESSQQGNDKSSAVKALCPVEDWFSDNLPLGVDPKVVIERTAGKWILEASELHGNRGKETEILKAFLSRQVDGPVRLAYGRFSVSVPRQFILIGTTNRRNYLKDTTGARRFWPVSCGVFDVEGVRRDRDQLWAEAAARERGAASIRLPQRLWKLAAVEQEARRAVDPWEEIIEGLLTNGVVSVTKIPATDIWDKLGIEANKRDNRDSERVTAILERNGYQKLKTEGRMFWELVPLTED